LLNEEETTESNAGKDYESSCVVLEEYSKEEAQ
jgi:hypothetical protein